MADGSSIQRNEREKPRSNKGEGDRISPFRTEIPNPIEGIHPGFFYTHEHSFPNLRKDRSKDPFRTFHEPDRSVRFEKEKDTGDKTRRRWIRRREESARAKRVSWTMALTRTFRALLSCASWKRGMSVGRRSTGRRREEKEPPRPSEIGKDGVHLRHIVDLTGGKLLPNQEQNARLSEDVKDAMVQMQREDPER